MAAAVTRTLAVVAKRHEPLSRRPVQGGPMIVGSTRTSNGNPKPKGARRANQGPAASPKSS